MDHKKELILEMLTEMDKVGKKSTDEIVKLFPDWNTFELIFNKLKNEGHFNETTEATDGWYTYYYELNNTGRLKIEMLVKEKTEEIRYQIIEHKERIQSKSRTNWTKVIGWGTILLIGMTGFLIWLELRHSKTDESYSKAMDSASLARFIHKIDSVKKAISDSTLKAQPSDNIMIPVKVDSRGPALDSETPNSAPKTIKKHPDKDILDSLEVLSPNRSQLVQIAFKKGTRNIAYGMELADYLKKNGYTKVDIIDAYNRKLSQKKVYFTRLEHCYILVYINVY